MEKFIIEKGKKPGEVRPIAVRADTYKTIKQISYEAEVSIVDLIDAMVEFCYERLVIEEQ